MWNYLRNLQNKPLHTRKIILYVSTIVLFSFVVLLWVLLLNIQKVNESKTPSEGILSPFDGIKETFTEMFEKINTSNIPALPQGSNEDLPVYGTETSGTMNPSDMNTGTENHGIEMGTTTTQSATGTPGL